MAWATPAVAAWECLGRRRRLCGWEIFTVDLPALGDERHEPLLVLHGFPTSSFDFHRVVDDLRDGRRVLLLDFLGYGLSEKPDRPYTLREQADVVAAFVAEAEVGRLALLTHDMGDTVGGELLARQAEGTWEVDVTRRVLTNGSIYIAMAELSAGQRFLLGLPDRWLGDGVPLDGGSVAAGVVATFAEPARADPDEVRAVAELVAHRDGHRALPRTIRYIEERRREEGRFTGAIEAHPSPLSVVWGAEDPIAVVAMVDRLRAARPDATVRVLDGVGHYPMLEAPALFAAAVAPALG
ncbi:MAG: alpha/beta fold hydrolase [Acidimicrobiales bacterium]